MSGLLWRWVLGTEPQVSGRCPSLFPISLGGVAFSSRGGGSSPFSVPALALALGLRPPVLSSSPGLAFEFCCSFLPLSATYLSTSQHLVNTYYVPHPVLGAGAPRCIEQHLLQELLGQRGRQACRQEMTRQLAGGMAAWWGAMVRGGEDGHGMWD